MSAPSDPASLASLAARVAESLRERGQTVGVIEDSAGGLVSAALLAIPGVSAYFIGGAVIYTRQASMRETVIQGTAGYVTRMSGGVGGRGREASSYPD